MDEVRKNLDTLYAEQEVLHKRIAAEEHKAIDLRGARTPDIFNRDSGKSLLFYTGGAATREREMLVDFYTLRRMSNTIIVRSIVNLRLSQVGNFSGYSEDESVSGWKIGRKASQGGKTKKDDAKVVEEIAGFISSCGKERKKWGKDTFEVFLRKIVEDSLIYDQATFEIVRKASMKGKEGKEIIEFFATDGSTYLLLTHKEQEEFPEVDGFKPVYLQKVFQEKVAAFYPWELCFGVRNANSNIDQGGYGRSELEDLLPYVTWQLNSEDYNGSFFRQGSAPKGILNLKKGVPSQNALNKFRQQWETGATGVEGAHRMVVLGEEQLEWIDMQKGNREMEFREWQDYCIRCICAAYKTDPVEIGFPSNKGQSLFQGTDDERRRSSIKVGLHPVLRDIERWINKYLISEINPDYEFRFTGFPPESRDLGLEDRLKRMQYTDLDEIRKEDGLPPLKEGGDVVSNQYWMQNRQAQQFGGDESNEFVDGEEEGGDNLEEAEGDGGGDQGDQEGDDPISKLQGTLAGLDKDDTDDA